MENNKKYTSIELPFDIIRIHKMQPAPHKSLDDIATIYYNSGDFTRKSSNYYKTYEEILSPNRLSRLSILELGVSSGASLLVWKDYLPNARVVGIDIAEMPEIIRDREDVHFVRGGQDDPLTLSIASTIVGGQFDIIIDDASHIGYLTKRSLHFLFPRILKSGGWYVVEDFGTGYLPEYPDGDKYATPVVDDAHPGTKEFRSSQHGMVGVVKQLIEYMMQELMTGTQPVLSIDRMIIETNIAFLRKK